MIRNPAIGSLMRQFGPVTGGSSVNTPTLSIADNGDGTGAVATIAGATAGTTNTVYVSDWPGTTFASGGSRSGNGTVSLGSSVGPHWAYVLSNLDDVTAASNLVHFRATDATEAVFLQCLEAVQDAIQGLALSGIDSANVEMYKHPWTADMSKPGVVICPAPERYVGGTNQRSDIGYGITVAMARVSTQGLSAAEKADGESELTSGLGTVLLWREQIAKVFRDKALSGVDEVYRCAIEPGHVLWAPGFLAHHDVSVLVVRCYSRESNAVS